METINNLVSQANGYLFSLPVVYALLGTGVLFTVWTKFGQIRALTHGISVVRGKYDSKDDPGAISHFQALSAALSATVGLGNIGGVALAIAIGGPGAVLWMWIIGIVGMALKMTEVTQSMLYRNTDEPDNPHGGPMYVVRDGLRRMGLGAIGSVIGAIFVVTLLISALTGGNMFQAWNVADLTQTYFQVPTQVTGIILAVIVGAVIIGGIKRIGSVAGKLVPIMCVMYLIAGIYVLMMNFSTIPGMLGLIIKHGLPEWLGGEATSAGGAFLGGTSGLAFIWGVKRALFSSEAGQGSAPIAHSAAKTDEPVREGVVAGLEPFIDTLVVCTLTSLVILSTGAWNRDAETAMAGAGEFTNYQLLAITEDGASKNIAGHVIAETDTTLTVVVTAGSKTPVREIAKTSIDATRMVQLRDKELERIREARADAEAAADDAGEDAGPGVDTSGLEGDVGDYLTVPDRWIPSDYELPARNEEARRISGPWADGKGVFVLVNWFPNEEQGTNLAKLHGKARETSDEGTFVVAWEPMTGTSAPSMAGLSAGSVPVYGEYAGASLTAHAFDRVTPGLGKYLVTLAAWLFAISTMISWSYYGEQGVIYLGGQGVILPYKVIYCALIVISTLGFIRTDAELDMWTTLGLGVMLVANIPIMLIFGAQAMKAYHEYGRKLKGGEFDS